LDDLTTMERRWAVFSERSDPTFRPSIFKWRQTDFDQPFDNFNSTLRSCGNVADRLVTFYESLSPQSWCCNQPKLRLRRMYGVTRLSASAEGNPRRTRPAVVVANTQAVCTVNAERSSRSMFVLSRIDSAPAPLERVWHVLDARQRK
jgi:hypothetical protein